MVKQSETPQAIRTDDGRESFDVIVVGAGQAGLAVGWHLAKLGVRFVLLDGSARIGDSWRNRWDSLRLFTPARYDGLVGMRFPGPGNAFPTKNEMGDYLEAYARKFNLPVRNGVMVEKVSRRDGKYVVEAGGKEMLADHVVVATASYQRPRLPEYSADMGADIVQLHSSEYRSPSQLRPGEVLLVGAGNSGSEIAMELSKTHKVWLSGRDVGEVPFRMDTFIGLNVVAPLVLKGIFHYVLTIRTPMGRKARPNIIKQGGPLIRVKSWQMAAAGVERAPRTAGVKDGKPILDDGRALDVANVIWCTGFHPGFAWIDLPIFGDDGHPHHDGGIALDQPGLYFVGMHFQYAMSSTMIHGVSRDAKRIVAEIAARRG